MYMSSVDIYSMAYDRDPYIPITQHLWYKPPFCNIIMFNDLLRSYHNMQHLRDQKYLIKSGRCFVHDHSTGCSTQYYYNIWSQRSPFR